MNRQFTDLLAFLERETSSRCRELAEASWHENCYPKLVAEENYCSDRGRECISEEQMKKIETKTLWMIVLILIVLWLLGVVTNYTLGGLVHILLVAALAALIVRLLQRRNIL